MTQIQVNDYLKVYRKKIIAINLLILMGVFIFEAFLFYTTGVWSGVSFYTVIGEITYCIVSFMGYKTLSKYMYKRLINEREIDSPPNSLIKGFVVFNTFLFVDCVIALIALGASASFLEYHSFIYFVFLLLSSNFLMAYYLNSYRQKETKDFNIKYSI